MIGLAGTSKPRCRSPPAPARGESVTAIAKALKVGRWTLYRALEDDPLPVPADSGQDQRATAPAGRRSTTTDPTRMSKGELADAVTYTLHRGTVAPAGHPRRDHGRPHPGRTRRGRSRPRPPHRAGPADHRQAADGDHRLRRAARPRGARSMSRFVSLLSPSKAGAWHCSVLRSEDIRPR
ncbi:hypothetical protein GCM10014719_70930 [Planomonospora parontospora subsp. antibiotica]|nr:hypothetical protein GCM10014719_70930 [Planomonospora parontospora subsp. antibiotica]GII19911.1 hypothetical protein Ppa05_66370 [Planomonospora parontospora subsp. antibiotica]